MPKLMQMAKKQGSLTAAKKIAPAAPARKGPLVTHDAGGGTTIHLAPRTPESNPKKQKKACSSGGMTVPCPR